MSAEVEVLREAAALAEPPDKALVGLFDPTGEHVPGLFERDDSVLLEAHEDSWYDGRGDAWLWVDLVDYARSSGRQLVRLYREDDPAIIAHAEVVTTDV